jgi:hypothetical protein
MATIHKYKSAGGLWLFIIQLAIFGGIPTFIIGEGWMGYFQERPGYRNLSIPELLATTLFLGFILTVSLRATYIRSYLRPKFEQINLGEGELIHVNYCGLEDARIPYGDINKVENIWAGSDPTVKARWKISGAGKEIVLGSNLVDWGGFWRDFSRMCKVQLPEDPQKWRNRG